MSEAAAQAVALVIGARATTDEMLDEVRGWVLECLDVVHPLPPLGFIADLGRLLLDRRVAREQDDGTVGERELRHALADYAEHVIGRLRNDPRLMPVCDALAAMPKSQHAKAVAALCGALMERIGAGLVSPRAAELRRLAQLPSAEILERAGAGLEDPDATAQTTVAYEALTTNARRIGVLLREADVFMLENLEGLPTPADRLAFAQTAEAAELLEAPLPRRARRRRTRAGASASALEDESTYPTGGFSSISNVGSLENLVTSELAYLGDGKETDLFDVRYVTGELLKYTRDESVFLRMRRTVVFWLAPELARARVKDAEAPWQRLVLATGLVVAATRRLFRWLDDAELTIDLRIPSALADEQNRITMLLREWVESGHVICGKHGPREALDQELAQLDKAIEVDVVALGYDTDAAFPVTVACGPPAATANIVVPEGSLGVTAWQALLSRTLFALV